jgi:hypothetical protein
VQRGLGCRVQAHTEVVTVSSPSDGTPDNRPPAGDECCPVIQFIADDAGLLAVEIRSAVDNC